MPTPGPLELLIGGGFIVVLVVIVKVIESVGRAGSAPPGDVDQEAFAARMRASGRPPDGDDPAAPPSYWTRK